MDDAQIKILAELKALRERYCAELPAKISRIRAGLDGLRRAWDVELLRTLHRQAHSLTGSGATFGYNAISSAARKLELLLKTLLDASGVPVPAQMLEIEQLLSTLEQADRKPSEDTIGAGFNFPPQPAVSTGYPRRLVFVIDVDNHITREQRLHYELHGYQVREFHDLKVLKAAIQKDRPLAIVMDAVFPQGELAGIELLANLRSETDGLPPVIFVSQRGDLKARLASVRAGAAAYHTKPLDLASLTETLDRLTTPDRGSPYRVLIVDDDENLAYHNSLILQHAGMQTQVATDTTRILELLACFQPELILMDLYLPMCTGIELAGVIRQHDAYIGIPIVFLSIETDINRHHDAIRAGADDFLLKPIAADHLLTAIEARVRRARNIASLTLRDSLTGLLNHTALEAQLNRELALQARHGGELSYALIDLDNFKKINDRYGHAAADRVMHGLTRLLRQRYRQTDLLGRHGGEEFEVVLPGANFQVAARWLDEIRIAFSRMEFSAGAETFTSTLSVGVAGAPPFNETAALQGEADHALYRAKHSGRNRVYVANDITKG